MNLLDAFILIPIAYFAYSGFKSGFIYEFFGIAGIILAVFIAFQYMSIVAGIFAPLAEDKDFLTIITGIVLFVLTIAFMQYIAYGLHRFFELIRMSILNRIAGLLFGALKSAIVISAILLLLTGIDIPEQDTRAESVTYPTVVKIAPATFNVVASVFPGTRDFVATIEKAVEENNPMRTLPIFEKLDL